MHTALCGPSLNSHPPSSSLSYVHSTSRVYQALQAYTGQTGLEKVLFMFVWLELESDPGRDPSDTRGGFFCFTAAYHTSQQDEPYNQATYTPCLII